MNAKLRILFSFLGIGLITLSILTFGTTDAEAYSRVRGYVRRNGTYVMPHYRTYSNSRRWDNWSSRGNYNPFTGRKGYRSNF